MSATERAPSTLSDILTRLVTDPTSKQLDQMGHLKKKRRFPHRGLPVGERER
jgi:hypothetical protein